MFHMKYASENIKNHRQEFCFTILAISSPPPLTHLCDYSVIYRPQDTTSACIGQITWQLSYWKIIPLLIGIIMQPCIVLWD